MKKNSVLPKKVNFLQTSFNPKHSNFSTYHTVGPPLEWLELQNIQGHVTPDQGHGPPNRRPRASNRQLKSVIWWPRATIRRPRSPIRQPRARIQQPRVAIWRSTAAVQRPRAMIRQPMAPIYGPVVLFDDSSYSGGDPTASSSVVGNEAWKGLGKTLIVRNWTLWVKFQTFALVQGISC